MEIIAVKVRNPGDSDFRERYDNRLYVVPPGGETLVPPEAAKLWVGDWDARNFNEIRRPRDDEVNRLKVKYGVYDQDPLPKAPLEVYDVAGGRISSVLDDPFGETLQAVVSGDEEKLRLQDLLQRYERELSNIRTQIKAKEGSLAIEDIPEDQGEDEPRPRRRRRAATPEITPPDLPEGIEGTSPEDE
jgi:hypothetical protein